MTPRTEVEPDDTHTRALRFAAVPLWVGEKLDTAFLSTEEEESVMSMGLVSANTENGDRRKVVVVRNIARERGIYELKVVYKFVGWG